MPNKKKNDADSLIERKIYIPFGMALVPEEVNALNGCKGCFNEGTLCLKIACVSGERQDGKHVIFKLVKGEK
jgi:hypothetical protein